jgi:uroporphyrinogen-III synthase
MTGSATTPSNVPPPSHAPESRPLHGCTVVVTREHVGELGRLLALAGADVVHVPLIEVVDVAVEEQQVLVDALEGPLDWVVVTSPAGAERIAHRLSGPSEVRLAAVGTATARRLAQLTGREVDLVPRVQLAAELVTAFDEVNAVPQRVVVAQADRAASVLADGLRERGHDVTVVTTYRTQVRSPVEADVAQITAADAITFASGSAATSWAEALGEDASTLLPRLVVVIGPSTAAAATKSGLKVTHIAADHSLAGLIDMLTIAWNQRGTE